MSSLSFLKKAYLSTSTSLSVPSQDSLLSNINVEWIYMHTPSPFPNPFKPNNSLKSLNLLLLSTIPNSITNLKVLTSLKISTFTGTTLPLLGLDSVREISIGEGDLQSFSSMKDLSSLTYLSMELQKISSLSDFPLSLQTLLLSSNLISSLSPSFGSLENLIQLDLSSNHLASLNSSLFSRMTSLTEINLQSNALITVPDFPKGMNLSILKLQSNSLTAIPNSITNLNSLKTLQLNTNQLSSLPSFSGLNIQTLNLESNGLTYLPPHFDTSSLTSLIFTNNMCLRFKTSAIPVGLLTANTCAETCPLDSLSPCSYSAYCSSGACYFCSDVDTLQSCSSYAIKFGGCFWTGNISKCVSKNAISSCSVITDQSQCEVVSSEVTGLTCNWCDSRSKCVDVSEKCIICEEQSSMTQCSAFSVCQCCDEEGLCRPKSQSCASCSNLDVADCTSMKNCKYCEESQKCQITSEQCKYCSEFTTCTPPCKSCLQGTCVANSSQCGTCSSSSDCPSSSCSFCNSTGRCMEKTDTCKSCEGLIGAICRANDGCKWCPSSSTCQNVSTSFDCKECSLITNTNTCGNFPGCQWCKVDQKCYDSGIKCQTCSSTSQNNCGSSGLCKWCSIENACMNATRNCLSCEKFPKAYCTRYPTLCQWEGEKCSWLVEDSKSSASLTTTLVIVISSSVATLIFIVLVVLKFKNHSQKLIQKENEMSYFSSAGSLTEIKTKQLDTELQTALSSLTQVSSLPELFLSGNVNELHFYESLEVNAMKKIDFTLTNLANQPMEISLYYYPTKDPHFCIIEPQTTTLYQNETKTLSVNLAMCCTSRLLSKIVVVSKEQAKFCFLPLSAESSPSSFLSVEEVTLGKVLGRGSFGTVYAGKYRGETVAVKQLCVTASDFQASGAEDTSGIDNEIKLMTQLRSPYIVSFYGAVRTSDNIFIVLEFCQYGSLSTQLGKKSLSPGLKRMIAIDCAKGMQFLHINKIIHRDLKTDNVLLISLSEKAQIRGKISDFGTSRMVGEKQQMTAAVGTPSFIAPEVIGESSKATYSLSGDVFSFAMLLWNLWTEVEPYAEYKTVFAIYAFIMDGKRLPIPSDCPFASLIQKCWAQNPDSRPTFEEIVDLI
eukprot:TRINITY_DN1705_c2_g1_i2.p1 TRINITY_DN1705_c2_g1~~TRINITY_DN1705_c2_g1_i2.p1  ORF type:complete len:1208 (-),score=319.24 TRINITY_DN1705_c2_g1_i2:43-3381(-)